MKKKKRKGKKEIYEYDRIAIENHVKLLNKTDGNQNWLKKG